jgi:drug/metabolite transporter (DMT)-like permease
LNGGAMSDPSRPAAAGPGRPPAAGNALWSVLALTFNAFTWGLSWWPFRWLQERGLHALWATVLVYAVAVLLISLWRPRAWGQLWRAPTLWWLVLASGATNAAFNTAVTMGDVVRVVLLFYLMPLWAVLLARLLLGERLTALAAVRVALALTGAAIVLWPTDSAAWPVPTSTAEVLALAGGFAFALNNVMLRREAHQPRSTLALAIFAGGAGVSLLAALWLGTLGTVPWPPAPAPAWMAGTLGLALVFMLSNLALQYGSARLPANATAVVMVSEVLFASVSAVASGAGTVSGPLVVGGVLILSASLLATWKR